MKLTRKDLRSIIRKNILSESAVSKEELASVFEKIVMRRPDGSWTKHWTDFARDSADKTWIGAAHFTDTGLDRLYVAMDQAGVIGKYFVDYAAESVETQDGEVQSEERPDDDRRYTLKDLQDYTAKAKGFEGGKNRSKTIPKSDGADSSTHLPKVAKTLDNADWWVRGMYKFLKSQDSIPVQTEAIKSKFEKVLNQAWVTKEFHVAVCMAIKNSSGDELRKALELTKNVADPDERASQMMDWYCGLHPEDNIKSKNKYRSWRTRCSAIEKYYGWERGKSTPGALTKDYIKKRGKDREIINEASEKRRIKITRKILNTLVREIILEAALDRKLFGSLESAITDSGFWMLDNTEDSGDYEEIPNLYDVFQTESAQALQDSLQASLDSIGENINIIVQSPELDANPGFLLSKDKPQYPDSVIAGGYATVNKNNELFVVVNLAQYGDGFDPEDVNAERIARKGAALVRHEIIHLRQIQKRAESEDITLSAALDKYRDENVIPSEESGQQDYIDSYIEVDAHAHQAADEIFSLYGKEEALRLISRESDLAKLGIDLPHAIEDYILKNPSKDTENKFRKKVYKHIIDMEEISAFEN